MGWCEFSVVFLNPYGGDVNKGSELLLIFKFDEVRPVRVAE